MMNLEVSVPTVIYSKRKPKIAMICESSPDLVLYACSEAGAAEALNVVHFPASNRQIGAALNPKVKQQKCIKRANNQSAIISIGGAAWKIVRLAGSHTDRLAGQ